MYTLDASVWVNAFDQRESGHAMSRQLLNLLGTHQHQIPIVELNLVLVEVAGAISRTRHSSTQAHAFTTALGNLPNQAVPLDTLLAQQALALAAQHTLRGADAVYAAVAVQAGCKLISLDNEHLTRLRAIVSTRTPADAVTDLVASPPSAS